MVLATRILTGCLANDGDAEEWIEQAVEIVNYTFDTMDPDGTISMPLSFELDEVEIELEDFLHDTDGIMDEAADQLQDVQTLEATGEYLHLLVDAFRMLRSYYDAHDEGIIVIFPPDGDSEPFKQGMEYTSKAGSSLAEARVNCVFQQPHCSVLATAIKELVSASNG